MSHIRCFLAIAVDELAAERVGQIASELREQDNGSVRWVLRENYHVNLAFLGEIESSALADACRITAKCAADSASFSWRMHGLGVFPNRRRPNVIWIGVHDPTGTLNRLHVGLEQRLVDIGYIPEPRPFRPHVTIGRVARGKRLSGGVSERMSVNENWEGGDVATSEVLVFGSELGKGGPRHSVLARCPLHGTERRNDLV